MPSLWDQLPAAMQGDHTLDSVLDLLQGIDGQSGDPTDTTDNNGRAVHRRSGHFAPTSLANLTFDPLSGQFGGGGSSGGSAPVSPTSWLTFPDLAVDWVLDEYDPRPGGEVALYLTLPSAVLTLPFLQGAMLDANQLLQPDPAHATVHLILPRLTIKIDWASAGQVSTKLVSASTVPGSTGTENVYQLCRMDPTHALLGPATMFGFGFDSAELYLDADPPGLPAAAHGAPTPWQGVHIPDAHVYVAPSGMQGVACAAGVHDLYIGFGEHEGITGSFDVLVVNRGFAPTISLSFVGADGRTTRVDDAANTAAVPASGHLVVLLTGGVAPYTTTVTVDDVQNAPSGYVATPVAVSVAAGGTHVSISAGAGTPAHTATRTITLTQQPADGGGGGGGAGGQVPSPTVSDGRMRIVSSDDTTVTVGLTDTTITGVSWTWDGGGSASGATAQIPLAAASVKSVTATYPTSGTSDVDVFYRYDHPTASDDGTDPTAPNAASYPYSTDPGNTNSTEAADPTAHGDWTPGGRSIGGDTQLAARLALLPAGSATVTGYASFDSADYDTPEHRVYNDNLANRRASGAAALLQQVANRADLTISAAQVPVGSGQGYQQSQEQFGTTPARHFWRATLPNVPLAGTDSVTATLVRGTADGTPPPSPPTPRQPPPASPSWFRKLQLQLDLERSRFKQLKILGEVDFYTATEQQLAHAQTPQHLPTRPDNSMDGVTDMTLDIQVDDAAATWSVDASFRAVDADIDGLWTLYRPDAGDHTFLDILGAYSALAPVLAATAPASTAGGDYVPLAIASGTVIALAAAGVLPVKQLTLHGVEAVVAHRPSGTEVDLIVDVETKIGLQAGIVSIDLSQPVTVRYKAIGFSLGWNDAGVDRVTPTFDASKGYTIDVPTGAVHAVPPLGDFLQVLGARVSHDNPTYIETEIGLAVDLGVVEVDRARVRVRLDQLEPPTLTALGAGIDVGVLRGRGYLSIDPASGDVAGSLDVTLADPLNLRVMAGLSIQHTPEGVLGVFVGMELDLPVPILLGSTGLGIYGFLGGVGVNMHRTENPADPVPALAWLQRQPQQNPIDPSGWGAQQGSWAFAIGALLGTADGGFILHLKGVVLLELPGPRLVLVMKADILSIPPELSDPSQQATILAVVDIDIGAGTISIGLVVDYSVIGLVSIHIPVQGFFTFADPPEWYLDVGTYTQPATVSVFDVFTGSGYLMLHGDGIVPYPPFPQLTTGGFTIAVGFHVELIWGDTSIGLYLKVGAGFDAIISFGPLALAGRITLEGELKLFIVSVGASAELDVIAVPDADNALQVYIHGQVCGHVDFFFFSVSGCVDFTLNSPVTPNHVPDPLVSGVQLVSRSPALVEGSGSDRSIDGVLASAQQQGTADPAPSSVPIDSIPVVSLAVTPVVPGGFTVLGAAPLASPGTPANAWTKRGAIWWRYTVESVTLSGALGAGQTPATWWSRAQVVDPAEGARLALLSWLPTPTPAAVPYGSQLTTDVDERWGSVCTPAAPPAPVLWTFDDQPAGPSPSGWSLTGSAWPDPPGTHRSSAPATNLAVHEPWRIGDPAIDNRRGIDPARVETAAVPCDGKQPAQQRLDVGVTSSWLDRLAVQSAAGVAPSALRQALTARGPQASAERLCTGGVLRSAYADTTEPSRHRDGNDTAIVSTAWDAAGYKPDVLRDAVRLTVSAGIAKVVVLVAIPRELTKGQLVLRALTTDGGELSRTAVMSSDMGLGRLPGEWQDATGPWQQPVARALAALTAATAGTSSRFGGYYPAVAYVDAPDGTCGIDIGWDAERLDNQEAPPFFVVAVQALLADEGVRYSWDDTVTTADQAALSAALTQEPDDHALLLPGTSYDVAVSWHAEWLDQADPPGAADTGTAVGAVTQTFGFATDGPAQAPARLDPWVLSTTPGAEEQGVFCDDPTRIVFATQKVADLFAAYGDTLELRLRSASGNHPQPGGPRGSIGPIASVPLQPPVGIGSAALRLLTPWEQAVREQVLPGAPCVDAGQRHSHSVVEIDYPLEPCTDYLLDVVRVGNGTDTIVFRRGFTTGRFRSVQDFADFFGAVRVEHAAASPSGSLAALQGLPTRPTGDAVDAAIAATGLDRPSVPRYPRVRVLWTSDPVPQPVAVIAEAAEPLWRSHMIPTQVSTDDPRDPSGLAWRDVMTEYFRPARDVSSTTAVTSIVAAPGLQRAVVLLAPGQRATSLALAFSRDADPLVDGSAAATAIFARVDLTSAPWEG